MPGVIGFNARIKKSGTATSFTDTATTNVSTYVWQITDTVKRILDRNTSVTVKNNGTTVSSANVTIDYLYGKITTSTALTGTVTVSGKYMPLADISLAKEFSVDITNNLVDFTTFELNDGYISRVSNTKDVTVDVTRFYDFDYDMIDVLNTGAPIVLELYLSSDFSMKGWFILSSLKKTLNVTTLNEETLNFQLAAGNGQKQTFSINGL
jgi:putative alpha-1,2-mannosidase